MDDNIVPRYNNPMTQPLRIADYQRLHEFRDVIRRFLDFSQQAARDAGHLVELRALPPALEGLVPATEAA